MEKKFCNDQYGILKQKRFYKSFYLKNILYTLSFLLKVYNCETAISESFFQNIQIRYEYRNKTVPNLVTIGDFRKSPKFVQDL